MSAQTKRTLYRLLALFVAAGAGDAIVQFATSPAYDYRHLAGALVVAAVMAGEKYISEQDVTVASPTVAAVNTALELGSANVPPPKVALDVTPPTVTVPPAA